MAVIKTGGKQYRVSAGLVLTVEKLGAEVGEKVVFDQVLLVKQGEDEQPMLQIGKPLVDGAQVSATVWRKSRVKKSKFSK